MDKIDNAKKEMFELLEVINEQTEMLKVHKGEIPQLYIDLLKKNVLKFYESVHTLDQMKHLEKNISKPGNTFSKDVKEEIKKDIIVPIPETIEVKEKIIEKGSKILEPIKSEPETLKEEEKPALTFSLNPTPKIPEEKKIFIHPDSDLFSEPKPSVADKLSANSDPSLGEKMQQKQIDDIKSAIGINDKFLFINELFAGDLKNYNRAVDQLNLANTKDEALLTFNSFKQKFNWTEKDDAVVKLKSILNRKYSMV